jgi:hypothetical protein
LAKLNPFTPEEIELAKTLNTDHQQRAILLTARELEPYHVCEQTKTEFDINGYGGTPEDLARKTANIYTFLFDQHLGSCSTLSRAEAVVQQVKSHG